nr:histone H2B subacrosomal variant-like [Cavia porcellus]
MVKSVIKPRRYFRGRRTSISSKKSCLSSNSGYRNYSLYVSRVLKEVVPERAISSCTVNIMNTLIDDIFERISEEAHHLMCSQKRCTLTPKDIQKAVYLLLPRKLAKYAVAFGDGAVDRYVHS